MRILHVSDAYLPKQGGIEVQVEQLSSRQRELGHEVEVWTCAPLASDHPDCGSPAAQAARRLPRPSSPRRIRAVNAELNRLLAEFRPDAVHCHLSVLSPLAVLTLRTCARSGIPAVATLHSLWWFATPLYWLADACTGWAEWPIHWTAVSELAASPLRGVLRGRAEVAILPNGLDAQQWADTPHSAPERVDPITGEGEVLVVSVMRLAARKRPLALIRAFRRAQRRLPAGQGLRLMVVGEGPRRAQLERAIRRYRLGDQVSLLGSQSHEQIRGLYSRADLYVAPAVLESFGIAALEARCAGLPVIARRQTGIADFIEDGVHGLLADNDRQLGQAISRLALDSATRTEMAQRTKQDGTLWSWSEVLQRCENSYKLAAELI